MTIVLEFPPETEARLRENAARAGQNVEDYLLTLAEQKTTPPTPMQRVSDEEFERISDELADSVGPDVPNWTEKDWSREVIYGKRA